MELIQVRLIALMSNGMLLLEGVAMRSRLPGSSSCFNLLELSCGIFSSSIFTCRMYVYSPFDDAVTDCISDD